MATRNTKHETRNGAAAMSNVKGDSSVGYRWYCVALFAVLYAISFIDRFMLTLTVDPVSRALGVGDSEIGLLLGAGFAIVYSLCGLPLGQMLDWRERRAILTAGVVIWSAATIASAFAFSFALLAVCRSGVALGEAVLTPAAVSMIADLFPREKRALPVALYAAVGSVMATGALIVDGAALEWAAAWAPLPGVAAWRVAMFLVGLPGLVVAALFWTTVREPVRTSARSSTVTVGANAASILGFFDYLRRQWRFYIPYFVGTALSAMYGLAFFSWAPTIMARSYGIAPSHTGYMIGAVGVPAALFGTFFWPWLAARLERSGRRDGIMIAYIASMIVGTPFFIAAPLAATPRLFLAGLAIVVPCLGTAGVLTSLAAQSYGPSRMRARLTALTLLVINIVGFSLGPLLVVAFAKNWPKDSRALSYGLAAMGVLCGPAGAIALAVSRRAVIGSTLLSERD